MKMVVDMSNFSLSIMEAEGNMEKGLGWKEISSAEPTEGQLELLIRIMMKTSPAYFGIKIYRMCQAHKEGAGRLSDVLTSLPLFARVLAN